MVLIIPYFDPTLKTDTDAVDRREHTLAEYLFPEVKFKAATIDPHSVKLDDIREYNGMTPEFSHGKRLYFADKQVRDLVYPNRSDGAAYASLLFTPCKGLHEFTARVLVVDDVTGATGPSPERDILPREQARKLVGDCHGKIDRTVADAFFENVRKPVQFRLGIKPQEECDVYRIGKGTLAAADLTNLTTDVRADRGNDGTLRYRTGYDLVLPTSSFKGRKGEEAIQPGEYRLTVGLGIKAFAEYHSHRLGTQVLVNYPKGVEADIVPQVERSADQLAAIQSVPHLLAGSYVAAYERRKDFANAFKDQSLDSGTASDINRLLSGVFGEEAVQEDLEERPDPLVYRILKADLENHGQTLDHPLIVNEMKKYQLREWENLALGRGVAFQAGMAQPSYNLGPDEVCVPFLPEGEELIVLRSPVLNSNGIILLTNKHLPEAKGLDGTIHIHPETAARHLQGDFDGDYLAFDLASKYPALTEEIRSALLPENRYPEITKREKLSYGDKPFEEIALLASTDKVGTIANRIQKSIALRWETTLLPEDQKESYIHTVARYYRDTLREQNKSIPQSYLPDITVLTALPSGKLTSEQVDGALEALQRIQRRAVGDLSSELQVAVDGFKSADRPNEQVLKQCKLVADYRAVAWIDEKTICKTGREDQRPFYNRPMQTKNYSPIDLMIAKANAHWSASLLEPAPSRKYQKLLEPLTKETPGADAILSEAKRIVATDRANVEYARNLANLVAADPDLKRHYAVARSTTNPDREILITVIDRYVGTRSDIWQHPDLKIKFGRLEDYFGQQRLMAIGHRPDAEPQVLGQVSKVSLEKWGDVLLPESGKSPVLYSPQIELPAPITEQRISAAWNKADSYRKAVAESTPPDLKQDLHRAIWQISYTKSESEYKVGRAAFAIFPEQVIARLQSPELRPLQVTGLQYETNEHGSRVFHGERVDCEVIQIASHDEKRHYDRILLVDGKRLGGFSADTLPLQAGTKVRAEIFSEPPASVHLHLDDGRVLKVGQLKNYSYQGSIWEGEHGTISLRKGHNNSMVAYLDGKALGILDKESSAVIGNPSSAQRLSFHAELHSPPPSTATIHVRTLLHPWQEDRLRREYEQLVERIVADPALQVQSQRDIDREIARIVYAREPENPKAALILTQSAQLREWKGSLPNLDNLYYEQARSYVVSVWNEARQIEHQQVLHTQDQGMER